MKRLTVSLLAVTLTACGGGGTTPSAGDASSAPPPVTVETTITESASPVSSSPAVSTPATTKTTTTTGTESTKEDLVQQMIANPGVGAKLTINGQQATTCVYGDGFGLHMVAAGENTSCEFATAVMEEQTRGLNATYDNVRDHLKSPVDAVSPVTGERYTMKCSVAASNLITCTGGNNATVFLF